MTTDEIVAKCLAQCLEEAKRKVEKQRLDRLAALLALRGLAQRSTEQN